MRSKLASLADRVTRNQRLRRSRLVGRLRGLVDCVDKVDEVAVEDGEDKADLMDGWGHSSRVFPKCDWANKNVAADQSCP